jgi:two-component system, chemotaxis family, sensor kinase Cph1
MKLRNAFIIGALLIAGILLASIVLSILVPNNVKCINGLCVPISAGSSEGVLYQFTHFFSNLFNTSQWPARWYCGNWTGIQGWNFIVADSITFLSYFGIPVFLIFFLRNNAIGKLPFGNIIWLFAFFILSCGITHALDALMFWYPIYNFLGVVKVVTAGVSFTTFLALTRESKKLIKFKSPEQLQRIIDERTKDLRNVNNQLRLEVEQRKAYELKLEKSIDQNKQLFLELHHRVKNNLQMVLHILDLNYREKGESNKDWINDIGQRIKSMSSIHNQLLYAQSISSTSLKDHVTNISNELKVSFANSRNIAVEVDIAEEIYIKTNVAMNLGLLLSEVITNSLKYAFEGREQGQITIKASETNGIIDLSIGDDGSGIDESKKREGSFGQTLIFDFASHINAEINLETSAQGTIFKLKIQNE